MARAKRILVVEDETDLAELICFNLQREGYDVRRVGAGDAALAELRRESADLVILDRMLPHMSGDDVAGRMKKDPRTAAIPIIMLTAKSEEADELVGFALGADDYVKKPFSMKSLVARAAAVLRRSEAGASADVVLTSGPVVLDHTRHEVTVGGSRISATATEFKILEKLMGAGGRVLDREKLIDSVFGPTVAITDRTVDVHIAALRKKLGSASGWIQTVRGVGYTFRDPH